MDAVLEAFLHGELGLDRKWFPWKVEALVGAGVLSDAEGEWWLAKWKSLGEPGPPVPDDVRAKVAAMDLSRDTMIELHRAGVVSDEQLLVVAEREGPIW